MSDKDKPNNNDTSREYRESEPIPSSRRDHDDLHKSLDESREIRNSMPPPPNPNRGGGQKDNE